jgi:hypothetical protein
MAWPKGKPRRALAEMEMGEAIPLSSDEPEEDGGAVIVEEVVPADTIEREPTVAELREYDRRINRDLSSQYERVAARVRAVLVEEYGADMADRIMADIAGVLKDPTRERNRRRLRPVA